MQIVEEYYFVLYFIYLLIFFVFSFDFADFMAGLWSVPAFTLVGFVLICVGVSPLAKFCWSHCPHVQ